MQGRVVKSLEWIEETLIAYTLAGMVVIAFGNAFLRRIFNSGWFWSLEVTLLMFLILVLFGMTYAARKTLHISVDAFVDILPETSARAVTVFSGVLSIIYASLMALACFGVFGKYTSNEFLMKVKLEDIPVPIWSVYALMTACFTYLAVTLIYMTYQVYQGRINSLTAAHEAAEEEAAALEQIKKGEGN